MKKELKINGKKKNGNLPSRQASGTEEPLEKQLWKAADKLRKTLMRQNTNM